MRKKLKNATHVCTLENTSDYFLKTKDNKKKTAFRNFILKLTLISEKNVRARIFFRSNAAIYFERKRHIDSDYLYIIHPFSIFRLIWEAVMIPIFIVSLTLLPLNVARNVEDTKNKVSRATSTHLLLIFCDLFCLVDIMLHCITGHVNTTNKEIYLQPRKIFWLYFRHGGFLVDFITSTPYQTLRYFKIFTPKQQVFSHLFSLLKVARSRTLFIYARGLLVNWQINTILFKLILYILMSVLMIHWAACMFIIVGQSTYQVDPNIHTWIDSHDLKGYSAIEQYKFSFFMAAGAFLCIKFTDKPTENAYDAAMILLTVTVGYIMCIYIFVIILQMVLSSNTPATKYQAIMSQLSQYMRHRQLPLNLQHRLVQYYSHRFRKTYFRESAIMPILSERLQTEINLHCYTALVENVSILQDLPEDVVSEIVAHLKSEIYLPNDVIIKAGTLGDCMYFIASGTVAVSTPTGSEVCHLQDGAYFGEAALIRKDNKRIANVVAIEFCEVYKLESRIFRKCLADQPETYKKLEKISQDRYNRTNFLEELYKKHVLERQLAKKHDFD